MAEIEIQTGLRENTVGMFEAFAEVAAVDPIVAVLLLVGALLVTFSGGVFGVLTLGAIVGGLR